MRGPSDLLTRAEAVYRAAVADPATAGPVAEELAAEARRAGDVEGKAACTSRNALSFLRRDFFKALLFPARGNWNQLSDDRSATRDHDPSTSFGESNEV